MATIKAKKVILKNRDGEHLIPVTGGVGYKMFDPVLQDHVLGFYESRGLLPQGTYAYKTAVAGKRFGYPTFYNKCVEEKEAATATETALGDNTITMYINANGHQFYDIADKEAIDAWYDTYGRAWFYGVDTENERIFLPRNSKYFRIGDEDTVGTNQDAGLPNIEGKITPADKNSDTLQGSFTGAFYKQSGGTKGGIATDYSTGANTGMGFDASRCSSIYGNSDTVEVDSVNMLLYICVGNTESDISWINVVEQVNEGVQDLEEKRIECLESVKGAAIGYDKLDKNTITNCVLETPQRIKHELNNGTLTIKQGSIFTIPYGTEDLTQNRVGTLPLHENYLYKAYCAGLGGTIWLSLDNLTGNSDTIIEEPMLTSQYKWVRLDLDNASTPLYVPSPNRYFYFRAPVGTTPDMVLGVDYSSVELIDATTLLSYGSIYITKNTIIYDQVTNTQVPNKTGQIIPGIKKGEKFLHDYYRIHDMQFEDNKFFVWAELLEDIVVEFASNVTGRYCLSCGESAWTQLSKADYFNIKPASTNIYASETTPALVATGNNHYWYDMTNNVVKTTNNKGTTWTVTNNTLPYMTIQVQTGSVTSVDQVFDGVGHIGPVVWINKGVKMLLPFGRNVDGTLINIEVTTSKISMRTLPNPRYIIIDQNGELGYGANIYEQETAPAVVSGQMQRWLNTRENIWYNSDTEDSGWKKDERTWIRLGYAGFENGNIVSLSAQRPFQAASQDSVDGQWIQKTMYVMSKVLAVGSYTYDLSDYLPNDGHAYEVMFLSYQNSKNTTYMTFGTKPSPYTNTDSCIYSTTVTTADGQIQPQTFVLPITDRKVYMQISNAAISVTSYLNAMAYRRLGTNI